MSQKKYGSLKLIGEKVLTKLSSPRKDSSPCFKNKSSGKKKVISDELTNGLKKLSGSRNISPELVDWINSLTLKKDHEKENAPASPSSFCRRGSIKPRLNDADPLVGDDPHSKAGKLYIRVAEMKHKLKASKGEKVVSCVVSVYKSAESLLKCTLATSSVSFAPTVSFEEGFLFDVEGEFDVKVEVFLQGKKDENQFHEIPESLGTLCFSRLSVVPVDMLTGEYLLSLDNADTTTAVILQLAIKPQELIELEREVPEIVMEHDGILHRQVVSKGGYYWEADDSCELQGRNLNFFNDGKKTKTITIDPKSKVGKPDMQDEDESLPRTCFQVISGGKPVLLMAQTHDDLNEWIEKLTQASQLCP